MKTKKEIREEYKQMKFPIGVFRIRNIVNGKIFIGGSMNLNTVWNSQKFKLEQGLHPNKELLKEWKEFGAKKFLYEIVDEVKQTDDDAIDYKKEVKALEDLIIEELQPFGDKGYNQKLKKI